jgi:hypothetical protein
VPGVVLEAGGIAHGVNEERVPLGDPGFLFEGLEKLWQGQRSFRFVTMNGGEDADPQDVAAALGPDVKVPRKGVGTAVALEVTGRSAQKAGRGSSEAIQRIEEAADGPALLKWKEHVGIEGLGRECGHGK